MMLRGGWTEYKAQQGLVAVVISAMMRRAGSTSCQNVDTGNLKAVLEDKSSVLWLDLEKPTDEELQLLQREFGFHELAMEDVALPHLRPKLDEYESYYFLVFYSLNFKGSELQSRELDLFVGRNYLVAIHREPVAEIEEALKRWEGNHEKFSHGVGTLVYSLLDSLVDSYFSVADTVADRVGSLEERIVDRGNSRMVQNVFALKKRLLSIRRILGPERDALNALMRQDVLLLDQKTILYLRDVYDHLVRITDTIDLHSDVLTSALDVHLAAVSNSLNQVMKTLTSWTIILMTLALIAGIYGMNFKYIPELSWEYGYGYVLGLMAAVGAGLYLYLKNKGWL